MTLTLEFKSNAEFEDWLYKIGNSVFLPNYMMASYKRRDVLRDIYSRIVNSQSYINYRKENPR